MHRALHVTENCVGGERRRMQVGTRRLSPGGEGKREADSPRLALGYPPWLVCTYPVHRKDRNSLSLRRGREGTLILT